MGFTEGLTLQRLAKAIDHSLLRPELTDRDVQHGIEVARRWGVAAATVKPYHVPLAARLLEGCDVRVGTVVGFPHGSQTIRTKVAEAREAVEAGAVELDMVLNIGKLRSGDDRYVRDEIAAVVEAAGPGVLVKVILETAYLSDDEKRRGCRLAEAAGAAFVKTSTGFAPSGATVEDVRLMRAVVGPAVQIKAAHGVRSLEAVLAMLEAGASRVGATATERILEEFLQSSGPQSSGPQGAAPEGGAG